MLQAQLEEYTICIGGSGMKSIMLPPAGLSARYQKLAGSPRTMMKYIGIAKSNVNTITLFISLKYGLWFRAITA